MIMLLFPHESIYLVYFIMNQLSFCIPPGIIFSRITMFCTKSKSFTGDVNDLAQVPIRFDLPFNWQEISKLETNDVPK